MKKILIYVFAVLVVFGMIGCSKKDKAPAQSTAPDTETEAPVTESETAAPQSETTAEITTEPESVEKNGVSAYSETFTSDGCYVTLMYPFYGDGEHELFDISMRSYAMQKYSGSGIMPEDGAVYEITLCDIRYESEAFVSAAVAGHIISPTAAHDTVFSYTVNADPRNGRIYLSEELIGDIDQLKTAFHQGRFEHTYGIDGFADALRDKVVAYEDITVSWRQDYGVFPNMYFTEDSFGIMAEVPHVVGGYAGFEIPYAETGDMINSAAKGLCGLIVATE